MSLLLALVLAQAIPGARQAAPRHRFEVNAWVSLNVAPSSQIRVNLNTTNVPVVHVSARPIDGTKWFTVTNRTGRRPVPTGPVVSHWDVSVVSKNQHPNPYQADTYYSRQVNLPPLKPGVYVLSFEGGSRVAWQVVNVTDLAVIIKRSTKRALAWVTDFKTGSTVAGAKVVAYTQDGQPKATVSTDLDGTAKVRLGVGTETFIVYRGSDLAGITTHQQSGDGRLVPHFQSDRPVYRPGQKIFYKAILRRTLDQGYSVVANTACKIQLRDPKDNPLEEVKLTSNSMGSVSGSFEIPDEGMTGAYSLVLTVGKDSVYQSVTVAAYRKPEFQVEAKPLKPRYLSGEEVSFQIDSRYYFGSPVQGATIHYRIRREPMPFYQQEDSEGWFYSGDGNLYARDTYASEAFVAEDTAVTDNSGKATITIKSTPKIGDCYYSLTCEVTDGSRRQVSGGSSVPVYGASIRLGLSTTLAYATLGSLIPVKLRAVDLDGKPVSTKVNVAVKQHYFDEKVGENKVKTVAETTITLPESGSFIMKLPAKEEGQFVIEATAVDSTNHVAMAFLDFYIEGNYEPPAKEHEQPTISVMLDKHLYENGDTVKAAVRTNNPSRPVLIVAEGGDIWTYKVLQGGKQSKNCSFTASTRMSPNAFVDAAQWVKGRLLSSNVILPIPDKTKQLVVEATPDKKVYHPGDHAVYRISTKDRNGHPVSAEVAMSVVDEAIYAISSDSTQDLYSLYWGQRENQVSMQASAPEELSGGAYQRVDTVAPVRQRFEDTGFWDPTVVTNANGTATVSFDLPGNLTSWRTTVRGITQGTAVGIGKNSVLANRPVMLRLATPRQMVQGDHLTLIGTVDNRSPEAHDFTVELVSQGIQLGNESRQTVHVLAKAQAKVEWKLLADKMPAEGSARLTGQVFANDNRSPDYADAIQVDLKIVPNGLPQRILASGVVTKTARSTFVLPADRIEPASVVDVTVSLGVSPKLSYVEQLLLGNPRYGSNGAANQLAAAIASHLHNNDKPVRECLALLSRTERGDGWGWWEQSPSDPVITARVVSALGEAKKNGITLFPELERVARSAIVERYNGTSLWEHRAVLAAAAALIGEPKAKEMADEVFDRGKGLSPYARLRLAGALLSFGEKDSAKSLVLGVLQESSRGPSESFVPVGEGTEWNSSEVETTSELLVLLLRLDEEKDLQPTLARWLSSPERGWLSFDESAALCRSLSLYAQRHPEPSDIGDVTLQVNGTAVELKKSTVAQEVRGSVPRGLLKDGDNEVVIHRQGSGEAFFGLEARVYRPVISESTEGVRVLRRFEVKNSAGIWEELKRKVIPGEPVRCTAVVWGDDIRDAVKVVEPIPAGFEYIEDESWQEGYQEVRDAAIVHYMVNRGAPETFRYYLRAESEGDLVALPATAEYLRRPKMRGQAVPVHLVVEDKK